MGLALDVGLAGLPLGIERVELKVQVMFGGLAGIDCAAEGLLFGSLHRCELRGASALATIRFCRHRQDSSRAHYASHPVGFRPHGPRRILGRSRPYR